MLSMLLISLMLLSGCFACQAESADVSALKISAPSGAPALALATLAVEAPDQYTFVLADTIAAEFSNATADFIIAPINAGAKLYKAGKSTYKLGAVISWGNLYFASRKADFSLEDVNGAEITLFGENTINASVALFALEVRVSNAGAIALYKRRGYTQAGLFVKAELIEKSPETVNAYLELVASSCEKCASDVDTVSDAAVTLEILPNAKVARSAIPGCAIRYLSAKDAKEQVERTANIDLTQFGGAVPADDFYYGAE